MRILEQMNSLELLLLRIFSNPAKYNEENGEIIKDPNWIRPGVRNAASISKAYEVVEILCKLTEKSKDDIFESLYFLEMNRLLVESTSNYLMKISGNSIDILKNKLTSKGKDFITFISK